MQPTDNPVLDAAWRALRTSIVCAAWDDVAGICDYDETDNDPCGCREAARAVLAATDAKRQEVANGQ